MLMMSKFLVIVGMLRNTLNTFLLTVIFQNRVQNYEKYLFDKGKCTLITLFFSKKRIFSCFLFVF